MRELLAKPENWARLKGDTHYYSPTLALCDEAEIHAERLGLPSAVTRGRLATNPETGTPMCNRPEEVERVSKLGQPVKSTLCKTHDHQGNARCCPYFDVCAYRSQFKNLSDKKMVRFEAHNYLTLPITTEERTIGLRIFDETFWRSMGRSVTLTVDELSTARSLGDCQNETEAANRKLVVNRLLGCMSEIASALCQGRPIIEAVIDYSANDLEMFALAEKWSDHRLPFLPDASASVIAQSLTVSEASYAGIWVMA
jgi:hypothetical protein